MTEFARGGIIDTRTVYINTGCDYIIPKALIDEYIITAETAKDLFGEGLDSLNEGGVE